MFEILNLFFSIQNQNSQCVRTKGHVHWTCQSNVVLFANAKWRNLMSRTDQIIMTLSHLRDNLRKHFGFDTIEGKIVD